MKKLIFSGIQPTDQLHIGNYLGSVKNWLDLQERYRCMFCVVDLHAITVPQDPKALHENTLKLAATYLAAGIDPEKSPIFVQSHIPEHAELAWILGTLAKVSEMQLMTQFKDKAAKQENTGASFGLLNYPILMAADILLYNPDLIPVGEDQTQHLELTRRLATRFNTQYGETFKIPEQFTPKKGAKIMGLVDPEKKMSKSDANKGNSIFLHDDAKTIIKKIKSATTDSDTSIHFDKKEKPGVSNLIELYHLLSGLTVKEIETQYKGKGYGDFKGDLANITAEFLAPIQEKINGYSHQELETILKDGANIARGKAQKTLKNSKKKNWICAVLIRFFKKRPTSCQFPMKLLYSRRY